MSGNGQSGGGADNGELGEVGGGPPPKGPLGNIRAERFAALVAAGRPIGTAYAEAGYKADARQASRAMARPEIQARIAELQAEWRLGLLQGLREVEFAVDPSMIDKSFVLNRLATVVERAMQAVPVRTRFGEVEGVWQFDGSVANRGLELLGKHLGMWSDRQRPGYDREISGMSDNELDDLSRRLGTLAGVEVDLGDAVQAREAKYKPVKQVRGARVRGKMVNDDSSAETGVSPMILQSEAAISADSSESLRGETDDLSECTRETEGFSAGEQPAEVPELERGRDLLSVLLAGESSGADCDTASADAISLPESSDSSSAG